MAAVDARADLNDVDYRKLVSKPLVKVRDLFVVYLLRSFLCSVLTHARLHGAVIYCTPQSADMSTEMSQEILELVTMAVDKFINVKNYEVNAYAKSISCQMSLHVALHLLCGRFHLP
jgi:hypothetical protein